MSLAEPLTLYWRMVGARVRSQMQYRLSFGLYWLASFGGNITEFVVLLTLFHRIPQLAGWSLYEVALLYGIAATTFGLAEMLAGACDEFELHVAQGTFDRMLIRPLGALFQVLTEDFALRRLGRSAQGVLVLAVALHQLALQWSADKVLVLALALGSGVAIYFSIFVLGAVFCFWTVQGREAVNICTYGGEYVAEYPMDIHPLWMRRVMTFLVPLAFVSYYPALYLLERPDPLGMPGWVRLASPVAAAVLAAAAWAGWTAGVRRYQSTGS